MENHGNYGLLKYRVTPIAGNLPSPFEILTRCRLRNSLPQVPSSIGKLWKIPGLGKN